MYNTFCLIIFIKIKLVIYCIWLVSFHHSAHFLYQFLIFFYFSFFYSKFCSKMYLIVLQCCCSLPKTLSNTTGINTVFHHHYLNLTECIKQVEQIEARVNSIKRLTKREEKEEPTLNSYFINKIAER